MAIDPTEDAEVIRRGQMASLVLNECNMEIDELTTDIVTHLVALHQSDTLTDTALRGMIGEIAGLHKLRKSLLGKVRIGRGRSEKING
jgi:hypothetical protein